MKTTNYKFDGKEVSYNVTADGYDIFFGGDVWISQHGEYGKPIDKAKSYEENCLAQIEELCNPQGEETTSQDEISELRAQVEYIAMMTDIDLTSIAGGEE